ncbi:hypothetical protein ASE04_19020 [Rhizobium sp. Root708]|nr:hypothetical protein ASE04_19020 [Rhizobium sp. Root708]
MPYVASPSYCETEEARASNLLDCLEPARRFLDETSRASNTEKKEKLILAATEAGWNEDEVRKTLEREGTPISQQPTGVQAMATIGLIPRSANTP